MNTAGEFEARHCYSTGCFVVVEEKARPILGQQTSELLGLIYTVLLIFCCM